MSISTKSPTPPPVKTQEEVLRELLREALPWIEYLLARELQSRPRWSLAEWLEGAREAVK